MPFHPSSTPRHLSRRTFLGSTAAAFPALAILPPPSPFRLAPFAADVTPPLGHPCMGGGIAPAREIVDPLEARGLILLGPEKPVVLVSVDWCEIRNDAYDRWRDAIAEAAGTDRAHVLLSSVHQHDAPVADLAAERQLRKAGAKGSICDPDFHEQAVLRVAAAVRQALPSGRPVTHVGTGSAAVREVASNRRYVRPDGTPAHDRMSATRDASIRAHPEGTVDPLLRTLSFWDGDRPLAAWSTYATHPMSFYGQGGVSADFPGAARRLRQQADPDVFQVYASGCSGNVVAGKYNDGAPSNRPALAARLAQAMSEAWQHTELRPLDCIAFRSVPLTLPPRDEPGFSLADLVDRIRTDPKPFNQCLAALGWSWRQRCDRGQPIDLVSLELGPRATYVLLPAESYVEFQLLAQRLQPARDVLVAGYGECGPGYIPTARAVAEHDANLHDWCWVAPGAEAAMARALQALLGPSTP